MQAIQTKYFGPSHVKGSRIKATAQAGYIYVGWDCALNSTLNHKAAAKAFAQKMKWGGVWNGGQLPDQSWAWVWEASPGPADIGERFAATGGPVS